MTTLAKTQPTRRHAALNSHEGFTLVLTLLTLLITSALLVAAFTAANGEIHLTSTDTAQKRAYYAAEAGIENYEYHLTQNGNYLSNCTTPTPANHALNQVGVYPLKKAPVLSANGEPTGEEYAIQLLPAESSSIKECVSTKIVETMVEEKGAATGTFRIESTGYSGGAERTIVATFRNANFVSYVWYTKFETADPSTYGPVPSGEPSNYYTACGQFYGSRPGYCTNNYFGSGESVNGPLHTSDHAGICGKVTFGRTATDRIEFGHSYGGDKGYSNEGCGTAEPTFKGTHIEPEKVLSIEPPPGDEELEHIVEPEYHYYGKTEIILNETTMTVIEHKGAGATGNPATEEKTKLNVAFPHNGVIYVSGATTGGTCKAYSPYGPIPAYTEDTACGNVYVHGKYSISLTIAAENDVVINENILTPTEPEDSPTGTPTTNALLGLIANNFVRIYHPLTGTRPDEYQKCGNTKNDTTSTATLPKDLKEPIVYAGILAVKHSVIVDNFDCGEPNLGHLNVYGAVAGLFSNGLTGLTNGGTLVNGYTYNANYDNRLQVEEPPHFLNPIEAAWFIQRQTLAPNP